MIAEKCFTIKPIITKGDEMTEPRYSIIVSLTQSWYDRVKVLRGLGIKIIDILKKGIETYEKEKL
jgi:hypothetical protein